MAWKEHLEKIKQGVETWNQWREEHPDIVPDLSYADLWGVNLSGANLRGANLRDQDLSYKSLRYADLRGAKLRYADLSYADLSYADLRDQDLSYKSLRYADLGGANLSGARLERANLSGANLSGANLSGANLSGANLSGANLSGANLDDAVVSKVTYLDRKHERERFLPWLYRRSIYRRSIYRRSIYRRSIMRGKYQGIRVASCHGNAIFKRDAEDQDFLDALEEQWKEKRRVWLRYLWLFWLFWLWGKIDYGRSMLSVVVIAVSIIGVFGFIYCRNPDMIFYGSHHKTLFTPFYFSIVTFTTLGFGDVTANGWVGEMVVSLQVILGYVTLGLLISILANKVARRS